MPAPADKIWLPDSHTFRELLPLNRALNAYDERLRFGRNEDTGDWCVFLVARGEAPIPVLGFQDKIPSVEECMARVDAADTKKHGDQILDEINKHNAKIKADLAAKADEAEWQLAEAQESWHVAHGTAPYARSYSKAVESRRTGGK